MLLICYCWFLPHVTSGCSSAQSIYFLTLPLGPSGPWSLGKHWLFISTNHHPWLPTISAKSWKDYQVDIWLWHYRRATWIPSHIVHAHLTYFFHLSITVVNCCFPGRLASCNCPSAFAQRCVALYLLCQDEKNIWPYLENLCQSPVLLLLVSPPVFIISR